MSLDLIVSQMIGHAIMTMPDGVQVTARHLVQDPDYGGDWTVSIDRYNIETRRFENIARMSGDNVLLMLQEAMARVVEVVKDEEEKGKADKEV